MKDIRFAKLDNVKTLMKSKGIDYVIVGPTSNLTYLTGFETEQMERPILLLISAGSETSRFLVPKLYEEQISALQLDSSIEVISYEDNEDPYSKLELDKNAVIAFDDNLFSRFSLTLINRFQPRRVLLASEIFDELRMIKSEEEIAIIKEGIRISIKSFECFLSRINNKMSEKVLANTLKQCMLENGADKPSFELIVTSGPNAAMPHLNYTDRIPKEGEPIVVDFGVKYKGYSTDMTRIVTFGKLNSEALKVYQIVREAQELAESKVSKGMIAGDLDKIAHDYISSKGYGQYFIHRLGHGIGIDVHEKPYIAIGNNQHLDNGMVFTVEPGIYIPNRFGIRLEDMVAILNDMPIVLTLNLEKGVFSI